MWKISKTTRLSSYPKYFKMKVAAPLFRRDFLSECALPDSLAGMRRYAERLELQEEADLKKKDALQKKYVKGWAIAGRCIKRSCTRILRRWIWPKTGEGVNSRS